ncbi:NlpC/P60 family protein [Tistlia consotensis]|uniref:NlpC/P60 family protein n=1 Tax=Tistlia consotensis USBA 355 TaxID=560819 RepID=A0A1Y6CR53_9PROT|nr:NlpC/P60 family protein [Tistlia consotensis]SMF82379.1 NlpC/P60 family protein [Tistlia consotensis USBA 355]SNS27413.1 NlpC/P60 family protein [Tistlia consotensis]
MSEAIDPRLNAFREDLADARLEGRVEARHYSQGRPAQVAAGILGLHRRPDPAAPLDSQLLSGEAVRVFETRAGWSWVQNETDGYVGYCRSFCLSSEVHAASHRVIALSTPVFPEPTIKAPVAERLSLWGSVKAVGERGRFVERAEGGWVFASHLAGLDWREPDWVATAARFLGLPYIWGGRSGLGVDCSGLVQLSLATAGRAVPRDTYQQAVSDALGRRLPVDATPERGDVVYWKGHVGIALGEGAVLNATAFPLMTVIEPLANLHARARQDSPEGVVALRRPD